MLIFSLLGFSIPTNAQEYRLMETELLEFEYAKLDKENRDPQAPQYTGRWKDRATLNWDSNLARVNQYKLYWNHNIHTETIDTGAVKSVGWEWRLGLDFGRIAVFHHHHSRHVLDEKQTDTRYGQKNNTFPVEDSIVVKFKFIQKGK